jgi:hypothetical protein
MLRDRCARNTAPAVGAGVMGYGKFSKDAMKDNLENDSRGKRHSSTWKPLATAAAILAVVQACLTIEGRGIEGFVLWVLILFVGYWLLFTLLIWLWRRFRDRT